VLLSLRTWNREAAVMSNRRMTPKGQMSGNGSGPAIAHLPPHFKAMFEPRPPVDFKAPISKRKMPPYSGISQFVDQFETGNPPDRIVFETPKQRQDRKRKEKMATVQADLSAKTEKWDPHAENEAKTTDAYKTLFVARISFDTTEKKLQREFEQYGPLKNVRLVQDKEGKARGYAFLEYEHEGDMRSAYKHGDGKKIDGRRVLVDVERGRTVRNWKPRSLGGGMGGTRKGGNDVNERHSGRARTERSERGGDRDRGSKRHRSRSRDRDRRDRDRDRRDRGSDRDREHRDRRSRRE